MACGTDDGAKSAGTDAGADAASASDGSQSALPDAGAGPSTGSGGARSGAGGTGTSSGTGGATGAGAAPGAGGTNGGSGGAGTGTGGTPATGTPRPSWNTGTGFFVDGSRIYDANGAPFRIRGINHTHWWGANDAEAIPYIANAQPNAVRTVFGPDMGATTPEAKRAVAQAYIDHGIVPIVEYHSGTCENDGSYLQSIVDLWTDPANVAWLNALERFTILNVANEWGPNGSVWRDEYVSAVQRLRSAGVKNLLVIDAGECGQGAETILNFGKEVMDADPEKNVVFSVHMYTYWLDPGDPSIGTWNGTQPYDMNGELDALVATGLPLIVGEFSWDPSDSVPYTTRAAVQRFEAHDIGWIAWSWNQNADPILDLVHGYQYDTDADLTDFGALIVNDPEVGLKALATRATVFP